MVGLSFCDFAGTRDEKVMMAADTQKEWSRHFKVISNFSFLGFFRMATLVVKNVRAVLLRVTRVALIIWQKKSVLHRPVSLIKDFSFL